MSDSVKSEVLVILHHIACGVSAHLETHKNNCPDQLEVLDPIIHLDLCQLFSSLYLYPTMALDI